MLSLKKTLSRLLILYYYHAWILHLILFDVITAVLILHVFHLFLNPTDLSVLGITL